MYYPIKKESYIQRCQKLLSCCEDERSISLKDPVVSLFEDDIAEHSKDLLIELYNLTSILYSDSENDIYLQDDDTYQEFIFTRLSGLVLQSYNGPGTAEGINFYEFVTEFDGFMCQFRIKELFDILDEIKDENSELKDYLTKSLDVVKLRNNNEKALEIIINQESYVDTTDWEDLEEKYKFSTLLKSVGSSLISYDDCKDIGEEMLELSEHTIPEQYLFQINEFAGCESLKSIVIPESVTSIEDYAFFECSSLASVIIPESVISIGGWAFAGCSSLASVIIPESVISIGAGAFDGCESLTSVIIPESVTSIGETAFFGCSSLASVIIPESVISIGGWAFAGCSSLASVIIPESVISIGAGAFDGCESLTSVVIPKNVTSIDSDDK